MEAPTQQKDTEDDMKDKQKVTEDDMKDEEEENDDTISSEEDDDSEDEKADQGAFSSIWEQTSYKPIVCLFEIICTGGKIPRLGKKSGPCMRVIRSRGQLEEYKNGTYNTLGHCETVGYSLVMRNEKIIKSVKIRDEIQNKDMRILMREVIYDEVDELVEEIFVENYLENKLEGKAYVFECEELNKMVVCTIEENFVQGKKHGMQYYRNEYGNLYKSEVWYDGNLIGVNFFLH